MRLCSGQWDVKGSDPHNFWITSSKKEPLVLSFPSLFLQADMGMWCCLLQPWAGRELPRREQGRESSVTKNLHSICSCGNMFFGEAKGWSKIRQPSALSQAGLTAFASLSSCFQNSEVFSKSPDNLCEPSGSSILRAFNTRKHPSQAHTERAESSEEEISKRTPARHLPRLMEPPTAQLSAQPTCPIWGCGAPGNPGNELPWLPAPERWGGGRCGDLSLSGGSHCPGGCTTTPAPNSIQRMNRQSQSKNSNQLWM